LAHSGHAARAAKRDTPDLTLTSWRPTIDAVGA
jgi:hypothetical protein